METTGVPGDLVGNMRSAVNAARYRDSPHNIENLPFRSSWVLQQRGRSYKVLGLWGASFSKALCEWRS